MKQKADDINNEFLIIRMGKVAKFKVIQEFLLGEPRKTTKSSVNLSGALRELRNHHFQNTGQKRFELCQVARFLRLLGDKLLKLRKSALAWIYLTACHSWPVVRHSRESKSVYWMRMVTVSMEQTA